MVVAIFTFVIIGGVVLISQRSTKSNLNNGNLVSGLVTPVKADDAAKCGKTPRVNYVFVHDCTSPYSTCGTCGCDGYLDPPYPGGCKECGNGHWEYSCTPNGCNPPCNCPAGSSSTYSGPLCNVGTERGSCNDGCGGTNRCDSGVSCYTPETNNTTPTAPLANYLCINDLANCTQLSTNGANPTMIPLPAPTDKVYIVMAPPTQPAGTRGLQYAVRVDNVTASPLFNAACTPTYAGDICTGWLSTNHTDDVNAQLALAAGSRYSVWSHAGTLNACDDNVKTSWAAVYGYFKINTPPTIISVTPASGISGTETDETLPAGLAACNDNNPLTFTATYRDVDGCNDIGWSALWADDAAVNATNMDTLHATVRKGTILKVYAAPNTSGTCSSTYPVMQIYVNNLLVKSHIVTSNNFYNYFSSTPLTPGQVKIVMGNDCWGGTGNDTNLTLYRIKLNGFSTITNGSTGVVLGSTGQTYQFTGGTTYGSAGYASYGIAYDSTNIDPNCGALSGVACDRNYEWTIPSGTGGTIAANGTEIYTATGPGIYTDTTAVSPTSKVRWRATSATCLPNGTDLQVKYDVAFQGDIGANLNVYAYVRDHQSAAAGWTDMGDRTLDLIAPSPTVNSTVQSKTTYGVTWTANGAVQSFGTVGLFNPTNIDPWYTANTKTVTNTNSSLPSNNGRTVTLPVFGSSDGGTYSATPLWQYTTQASGSESINIGTIDSGQLKFRVTAVDNACNSGVSSGAAGVVTIGSTWLITKAGVVYSGGTITDPVKTFTDSGLLPNPGIYSWGASPFPYSLSVDRSHTQVSTELLSVNGATANTIISRADTTYNPFVVKNYSDANNAPMYQKLKDEYNNKLATNFTEVTVSTGVLAAGNVSTNYCPSTATKCVIKSAGDLSVTSGLICDRETAVFVAGNLTLYPDVKYGTSPKSGCIFIVSGNVTFKDGTNQSGLAGSTYPLYDLFELFVIADGQVTFERAASTENISDGIKIDGSVISLSNLIPSILWQRSLQLKDNDLYPSVVLHLDSRYIFMAPDFFEGNFDAYVKELGYKPY